MHLIRLMLREASEVTKLSNTRLFLGYAEKEFEMREYLRVPRHGAMPTARNMSYNTGSFSGSVSLLFLCQFRARIL
jgi:hypothetical protein